MFKKTVFALAAAGLALAASPALAASAVVGSWATEVEVMDMKIPAELTVTEAGGTYTVDIKEGPMPGAPEGAPPAPSEITEVAVTGDKLTFKRKMTTPQGAMNLAYAVTATGDALAGEITSDFGPIAIKGTRK